MNLGAFLICEDGSDNWHTNTPCGACTGNSAGDALIIGSGIKVNF